MDPILLSVGTLLERQAAARADRPFLSFGDGATFTYAEAADRAWRLGACLAARGLQPCDRVVLMLKNSLFYPVAWLGILAQGFVAVPVNSRLGPDDAGYIMRHSGARLVLCDGATAAIARAAAAKAGTAAEIVEVGAEEHDPAFLQDHAPVARPFTDVRTLGNVQYTSGTTGLPKGCLLSHGFWQRMGDCAAKFLQLEGGDRILTAQPFSYIDPLWNVMCTLQRGAHLYTLDAFHPSTFMQAIADLQITVFYCVGVMPSLLLKQPESAADRGHRLKLVGCSAIPPTLHRAIEARWGVPWREIFGMTESGLNIAVTPEEHEELVGSASIGTALPHCDIQVADEEGRDVAPGEVGELRLRCPGLMDGYLNDPEATARFFRDGWANTGDLVTRDEKGRIFFRGRRKEMIRRGGENIAQAEVEFALRSHADVLDCAVAPVPDELLGEEGKAYVVLLPGRTAEPAALHAFLSSRIAVFKVPRYWEFRADLPRTPSERIEKRKLEQGRSSWQEATFDAREGRWLA